MEEQYYKYYKVNEDCTLTLLMNYVNGEKDLKRIEIKAGNYLKVYKNCKAKKVLIDQFIDGEYIERKSFKWVVPTRYPDLNKEVYPIYIYDPLYRLDKRFGSPDKEYEERYKKRKERNKRKKAQRTKK